MTEEQNETWSAGGTAEQFEIHAPMTLKRGGRLGSMTGRATEEGCSCA